MNVGTCQESSSFSGSAQLSMISHPVSCGEKAATVAEPKLRLHNGGVHFSVLEMPEENFRRTVYFKDLKILFTLGINMFNHDKTIFDNLP